MVAVCLSQGWRYTWAVILSLAYANKISHCQPEKWWVGLSQTWCITTFCRCYGQKLNIFSAHLEMLRIFSSIFGSFLGYRSWTMDTHPRSLPHLETSCLLLEPLSIYIAFFRNISETTWVGISSIFESSMCPLLPLHTQKIFCHSFFCVNNPQLVHTSIA